ncbi:MAG: Phosphate import ATP-binding protein PstB 3 [candidate division TA06 bacterium ADurb.Bin417]|uniref:Phosphate import ATP-binding protein PstB 3 n=1 Tax=candidate division TA06 bacterium ADurb.Bin417 TaxID=1852828 RepID=A0A1V5MIM3_UNCT6|nr:MAG: Phosphate import ATP-binding protein PstB 3 [candidate division TA06 bacterium ADurb.Bin417]
MADPIIRTEDLGLTGNGDRLLGSISIELERNTILGIIGPTGSGKTSFLRVINRLIEFDHGYRVSGRVYFEERDIYQPEVDLAWLRRQIGMVFALPVPLPMSIYDNLAFGPRLNGIRKRAELDELVENSLRSAYLWGEVKDRLELPALKLSGGQQQRLCLARILALKPRVVLLDDPCSGLDPISTSRIEEAILRLKKHFSFILVTNNTKQVSRVADRTAFFLYGDLVEIGPTAKIFTAPADRRTNDYLTGRFG